MTNPSDETTRRLAATYNAPTGSKDFTYTLSSKISAEADVASKTKYLSELRSSVKTLQEDVNSFLTKQMEEDKTRQAQSGNNTTVNNASKTREEEEEQNYGEEAAEDDEG